MEEFEENWNVFPSVFSHFHYLFICPRQHKPISLQVVLIGIKLSEILFSFHGERQSHSTLIRNNGFPFSTNLR